jgi:anti-anti-sigma factor
MFEYNLKTQDEVVDVVLKGRLDATQAPALMEDMKKLIGTKITKIIFHMEELDYIASAGLRVIIFTKQKVGYEADVIMKDVLSEVKSVMEMTGLDNFVTFE